MSDLTYRWDLDASQPELGRDELQAEIVGLLRQGHGVVLYGGHGMGKSYLIRQLGARLDGEATRAIDLRPDTNSTAAEFVTQLVANLGVDLDEDAPAPVEHHVLRYLQTHPGMQLVLLYDEVDGYMGAGSDGARFFSALEAARKQAAGRLGVLAAGGLGLVALGQTWSSPFVSRAERVVAPRFTREELCELAVPLSLGDQEAQVIDALMTLSGGIPGLTIRGLRGLLEAAPADRDDNRLVEVFATFMERNAGYVQRVWVAIGEGTQTDDAARVWRALKDDPTLDTLDQLVTRLPNLSPNRLDTALMVLRAAGLVEQRRRVSPAIRLVPSILSLPESPTTLREHATLREQLNADLRDALLYIRRWGTTSYIRGGEIMPEAVFQTAISTTLAARGWTDVVQEAEQAGGRADITAGHPCFENEKALIEVKIWPRKDYKEIQDQVEKYRVEETTAMATVMVTTRRDLELEEYSRTCFGEPATPLVAVDPLLGVCRPTQSGDWNEPITIDHYLLRLPRS